MFLADVVGVQRAGCCHGDTRLLVSRLACSGSKLKHCIQCKLPNADQSLKHTQISQRDFAEVSGTMHMHGCLTRSKEDSHPHRYMSVRNPCILVQVAFPRGRVLITRQWELLTWQGVALELKRTRKKWRGEKVSIFESVKQWINCESVLCEVMLEMSSRHSLSPTPSRKAGNERTGKVRDRMVLLTGSRIIALEIMSVWHMHAHYVRTSFKLQLSTAHCIPLVVSMRHDRKNDIQGSVGKKADGYANQLSI